jgi:hypothetical protein
VVEGEETEAQEDEYKSFSGMSEGFISSFEYASSRY